MGNIKPLLRLRPVPGERAKISTLCNAIYYFFQRVFIISDNNTYRLIAIHNGKLLADESYKTAKGARIAFLKLYWYRAWREGVKPQWTDFYTPEAEWLEERFKVP